MSTANERQHGGDHYGTSEYQHWDWVTDCKLNYLLGCASKYVYRRKGEDRVLELEKAVHYLDKAAEQGVPGSIVLNRATCFWLFVTRNNVTMIDAAILWYIMEGAVNEAKKMIVVIIEETKQLNRL